MSILSFSSKEKTRFYIYLTFNIIFTIILITILILKRKREKEEQKKKKEEERLKVIKNRMIEMQKKMREETSNSEIMTEKQKNQKINNVLEDMCAYGAITKKEKKEEKEKHPEKFIETSQALKMEKNDEGLFALGLISQGLENLGIETK